MKISLKLQDELQTQHQNHHQSHHQPPLLFRAKIPITIFNLPFLSHFSTTTTHPSDLSLSLSTNFQSGPSLKLSYATAASATATAANTPPLSLTLKSGSGLFGSPNNSPLVISAHFSFYPSNPNHPNPTFSLLFKPQLGSFSLRKSSFSHTEPIVSTEPTSVDTGCDSNSFGFVPLEKPAAVKDLSIEKKGKDSIFKGIHLAAKTQMPLTKRVALNFRWWMNFSEDQMPVLRINKIGIQRVDGAPKDDDQKKKKEANAAELEVFKGMCFWMKRELDSLTKVNREMKCELEELKMGHLVINGGGDFGGCGRNKAMPSSSVERPSVGFEQWRSKRNNGVGDKENGDVSGNKDEKKNVNVAIDVENELQRAIKAAATGSP